MFVSTGIAWLVSSVFCKLSILNLYLCILLMYLHNETFPDRGTDYDDRGLCLRHLVPLRVSYQLPAHIILLESRPWYSPQKCNRGRDYLGQHEHGHQYNRSYFTDAATMRTSDGSQKESRH